MESFSHNPAPIGRTTSGIERRDSHSPGKPIATDAITAVGRAAAVRSTRGQLSSVSCGLDAYPPMVVAPSPTGPATRACRPSSLRRWGCACCGRAAGCRLP